MLFLYKPVATVCTDSTYKGSTLTAAQNLVESSKARQSTPKLCSQSLLALRLTQKQRAQVCACGTVGPHSTGSKRPLASFNDYCKDIVLLSQHLGCLLNYLNCQPAILFCCNSEGIDIAPGLTTKLSYYDSEARRIEGGGSPLFS
jgi:hypothetical protein